MCRIAWARILWTAWTAVFNIVWVNVSILKFVFTLSYTLCTYKAYHGGAASCLRIMHKVISLAFKFAVKIHMLDSLRIRLPNFICWFTIPRRVAALQRFSFKKITCSVLCIMLTYVTQSAKKLVSQWKYINYCKGWMHVLRIKAPHWCAGQKTKQKLTCNVRTIITCWHQSWNADVSLVGWFVKSPHCEQSHWIWTSDEYLGESAGKPFANETWCVVHRW